MEGQRSSQVTEVLSDVRHGHRRTTTTIRLLECLRSFCENVDVAVRGTEEDPHLSFVTALQHNYLERTNRLENDMRGRKGLSVTKLLHSIKQESAASLTTKDLARLISGGNQTAQADPQEQLLKHRQESLRESEALSDRAKALSTEAHGKQREGAVDEAKSILAEVDELFRQAVLVLRVSEEV